MNPFHRYSRYSLLAVLLTSSVVPSPATQQVLISASKPYDTLVAAIEARGGVVTHKFTQLDAIAAEIPATAVAAVAALVPAGAMSKDYLIAAPEAVTTNHRGVATSGGEANVAAEAVEVLSASDVAALATATPSAYLLNNATLNVASLHAGGINGAGVVVALIDTGIRPGFPHISLDGSVIGGDDFVGDGLGYSNIANHGHGTMVAGMVSANVRFTLSPTDPLRLAVLAEAPEAFDDAAKTRLPMIGTAPASSIYALRVFAPTGTTPNSRVIMAIERAIELRKKFDAGQPGGVNIQVCNLGLTATALFPGAGVLDTAVDLLLSNGIVPVVSPGNNGPSSVTVGTPGTALSAITVGAASTARNERILRRTENATTGPHYRPFMGTQTAYFSSRGPNADGRTDPDVIANGVACFGQGLGSTTASITIAGGTSHSAPAVSGVAALLRQAYPAATARQIRNAIIMSANPNLLADGSLASDQGAGLVDAAAASALLAAGGVPDTLLPEKDPNPNVKVNLESGSSFKVRNGPVQETFTALKPAQRHEIFYRVAPNTKQVSVVLSDVTPSLPPAQQNQLFGDNVLLTIHSALTSNNGKAAYSTFESTSGGTFTVDDPQVGIMRVTMSGRWTNAGTISGQVTIASSVEAVPRFTQQGKIIQGESVTIPLNVPVGVSALEFRLGWSPDWASLPTDDLDLVLISPTGAFNRRGSTMRNPEMVTIKNPVAGEWRAMIIGFEVHSEGNKYEFRATADGVLLK